jgi:cysteine synthase A
VVTVSTADAASTTRALAREEGLFLGISSGAAVTVSRRIAAADPGTHRVVVAMLPDGGARYLSTALWETEA